MEILNVVLIAAILAMVFIVPVVCPGFDTEPSRRVLSRSDIAFIDKKKAQQEMIDKHNYAVRKKQLAALSNVYA